MEEETKVRRNYKDTVFRDLFSDKKNAISLYNALNGTDYSDDADLEIVTLSDAIYMHLKNDVACLFQSQLSLWEQQSTLNYNTPLRGLIYFAHSIDGILKSQGKSLYGKRLVQIPTPSYYVLYNGKESSPEIQDLKLSDAFVVPTTGYEWTAHMLNVNAGHNPEIMEKCPTLKGYAALVQYVRDFQNEGCQISEAVNKATDLCIQEGYLKDYLLKKKSEVYLMLLTEFDEELFAKTMKEEGRAEGLLRGEEMMSELISKLSMAQRTADILKVTTDKEYRQKLYKEYNII